MGVREQQIQKAVDQFIENLPDGIENDELGAINFYLLVTYGKVRDDWLETCDSVVRIVAHYFRLHKSEVMEHLAEEETKSFFERIMKEHKSK
jgi:hypothetical protein